MMRKLVIVLLIAVFLFGCVCIVPPDDGNPTPTHTATPAHTSTPIRTPTPVPTSTPYLGPEITPPPLQYGRIEQLIFERVNVERANAGVPPLRLKGSVSEVARWQSCCNADFEILEHESEQCGTVASRLSMFGIIEDGGENIAYIPDAPSYYADTDEPTRLYGDEETATRFMNGWMNSPGHRANIMDPRYTDIGVGVCKNGHYFYGTQNFLIVRGCGYEEQPCCEEFGGYGCYLPTSCDFNDMKCR